MSFIDAATTGISDTFKTIATSVSEFTSDLGLDFDAIPEIELPIPNVLHDYATYDYIISISALHDNDINFPDKSYLKGVTLQPGDRNGKPLQLICKSGNADPNNRVHTDYGKFDFFIDELSVEGLIGYLQGNTVSSTQLEFKVKEPYSMGLFTMACQQAAWDAEHPNWNAAPFLLTIEFRGNDEIGMMSPIPNSTRYIPFIFTNIQMAVNETGATYDVKGLVWNAQGLSEEHSKLKTDMSIKGSSVQEVLQTGEKSLQSVWNKRLQMFKEEKIVNVPDEIIIMFPKSIVSDNSKDGESGSSTTGSAAEIYKALGLTEVVVNDIKYHVQKAEECNAIGKALLGFGPERAADAPFGNEDAVHAEAGGTIIQVRGKNTPPPTESDFKFRQDTDIPNAINQVILQSNFPTETLDPEKVSPAGYKKWWKIDIAVYNVSTTENNKSTGVKPKIIVYRVIPYNVHGSSGIVGVNQKAKGFDKMQVIKEYNYLYTGKNTDVINFTIEIKNSFAQIMAADFSKGSQDIKTSDKHGSEAKSDATTVAIEGKEPERGATPRKTTYGSTGASTDRHGGSGAETAGTRAAKLFHDTLINGQDMVNIDLRIVGDPAFLHHSGFGNYTSKPTQYPNLNLDGTANYQAGEVHVRINFRTPIEIDQTTGMYQFMGEIPSSPLMQYSGVFIAQQVTSTFRGGQFEQILKCRRYYGQELSQEEDTEAKSFSIDNITDGIGKKFKEFFS